MRDGSLGRRASAPGAGWARADSGTGSGLPRREQAGAGRFTRPRLPPRGSGPGAGRLRPGAVAARERARERSWRRGATGTGARPGSRRTGGRLRTPRPPPHRALGPEVTFRTRPPAPEAAPVAPGPPRNRGTEVTMGTWAPGWPRGRNRLRGGRRPPPAPGVVLPRPKRAPSPRAGPPRQRSPCRGLPPGRCGPALRVRTRRRGRRRPRRRGGCCRPRPRWRGRGALPASDRARCRCPRRPGAGR